jgi:nucleoside-diphosphate-sugar epimerase
MAGDDPALDILVTGGSGRLGRYVVAQLARRQRVVNADLAATAPESVRLDVLDLPAVTEAVAGRDVVVHLAALDYDTHAAAEDFLRVNALGSWHVLQACVAAGVRRVVVCSSVAALGLHEVRPEWQPQQLPVAEGHERRPAEPYSVSKLVVEELAQSVVRAHGIDVLCLRPVAVVFDEELDVFLGTVAPGVRSLYDYVTARDVAVAVELAATGPWSGFEVVGLSADDSAHPDPTLEWYPRLIGSLPDHVDHARFEADPRASVFANAAALRVLGWRPTSRFTETGPVRAGGKD